MQTFLVLVTQSTTLLLGGGTREDPKERLRWKVCKEIKILSSVTK